MSAWYIDTWVKDPLPVTSPTAHMPSTPGTRRWSSTGRARTESSSPTEATLSRVRSARRPVATSKRSATTGGPPVTERANRSAVVVDRLDGDTGPDIDTLVAEDLRQQLTGLRLPPDP